MILVRLKDRPGSWKVIETNSLALPKGCDYFEVGLDNVSIGFEFKSDPNKKQEAEVVSNIPNAPVIALFNFNNVLGTSIHMPAGHYKGKEIIVSLYVQGLGGEDSNTSPRNVTCTFIQKDD